MSMSFYVPSVAENIVWSGEYQALNNVDIADPSNYNKFLMNIGGVLTWRDLSWTPLKDGNRRWGFLAHDDTKHEYNGVGGALSKVMNYLDTGATFDTASITYNVGNPITTPLVGGKKVFRFSHNVMQRFNLQPNNTGIFPTGIHTYFLMFKPAFLGGLAAHVLFKASPSHQILYFPQGATSQFNIDGQAIMIGYELSNSEPTLITLSCNGGTWSAYINSLQVGGNVTLGNAYDKTNTEQFVGEINNAYSFIGDLYALFVTNTATRDVQMRYEAWLMTQYGKNLLLDISNPYRVTPPLAI